MVYCDGTYYDESSVKDTPTVKIEKSGNMILWDHIHLISMEKDLADEPNEA